MSRAALAEVALSAPSVSRDVEAKESGRVLLGNLRMLIEEAEDIMSQADGFATVSTWLPNLGSVEGNLAHTVRAMAAAGGLVAVAKD